MVLVAAVLMYCSTVVVEYRNTEKISRESLQIKKQRIWKRGGKKTGIVTDRSDLPQMGGVRKSEIYGTNYTWVLRSLFAFSHGMDRAGAYLYGTVRFRLCCLLISSDVGERYRLT